MNCASGNGDAHATERVWHALDHFRIELPSWGFSNTGTRFGKYLQASAATTLEEKFADAAQVNQLTGASPSISLHTQWDLPEGMKHIEHVRLLERRYGVRAGAINPNLFEAQIYKFGSIANPSAEIRGIAVEHLVLSAALGAELGNRDVSIWVPDGSNYPGTQSISRRIAWMEEALCVAHASLAPGQRMLLEYKPFEPAFYHTDVADWGMALHLVRVAGPQASVLVDTGHHAPGTNVEQIVAWLLHLNALGGFHFNDRKYADDDLTLGSIDPYQLFRIFHEIARAGATNVAYTIDQSHNLKGKLDAMVQSVVTAQELVAKAALVDQDLLAALQDECRLVEAEECFRSAFWTDVRPLVRAWRQARNLPQDPQEALRQSGYLQQIESERASRNAALPASYA